MQLLGVRLVIVAIHTTLVLFRWVYILFLESDPSLFFENCIYNSYGLRYCFR